MTKLLNYLLMLVSIWLAVSSLLFHPPNSLSIGVNTGIGAAIILLAILSLKKKTAQWPAMATSILGFWLLLWGIFIARLVGADAGVNEILSGCLTLLIGIVILPFQLDVEKVDFYNRNGGELATFTQIRMKNENILAKAILLGSMPETIYMYPEEICKAVALMDIKMFFALPKILYLGWKRNRAKK